MGELFVGNYIYAPQVLHEYILTLDWYIAFRMLMEHCMLLLQHIQQTLAYVLLYISSFFFGFSLCWY